ncbi:Ig-like domain-containing protein [Flavobacterium sp. F372]|uniref:Ig-like domain-containing protein n=1 Tax=Flavobacterium bernardetii TaxID=2813823 RepID=A0ABR7IYV6_9FLAO|nr:Ig-like domain-containing protein [Flavobacterium bernardetii]MBC5834981.1 Ig-like domain-containing protein [Flavobacterium bernardetii]NHF70466.1 Ig-like domain-containing protein [Flavobacterium bernardetii]
MRKLIFILTIISALFISCAKRGTITGGPKDTIAPVIVKSKPKNYETNFTGKTIKIDFSEYIKVKDINKQLIISPPMEKTPTIVPQGSASKFISITLNEDLKPNTTYSFNFGQSITDYNEGIPYSQFKYIFSTGAYVDSLTVSGNIKDAFENKTDDFVTVMLYDAATYNDSLVYKKKPIYITNTLEKITSFKIENIKEGEYYLVALKDKNNNYNYQSKSEKIAFKKEKIKIPNDSTYSLSLFAEKNEIKTYTPTLESNNKLFLGYEGDAKNVKIFTKKNNIETPLRFTKSQEKKSDTLQVFIPNDAKDSINVIVKSGKFIKDYSVKLKKLKEADSLKVSLFVNKNFNFNEKLSLKTTTPIQNISSEKIVIRKKDSTSVPFTTEINDFEQLISFDFKQEENEKYTISLLPGAIEDDYNTKTDSLKFDFTKGAISDFGNLKLRIKNVKKFPYILQILNNTGEIVGEKICTKETEMYFEAIQPSTYQVRLFYDDNNNQIWDSGNFKTKLQPEEMIYFPALIDVRANWDVDQELELN